MAHRFSRVAAIAGLAVVAVAFAAAGDTPPNKEVLTRGAELFARDWMPADVNGSGGDGLGPLYNETSCVACHFQGGPGGAGPTSTNVEILTAGGRAGRASEAAEIHPGFRKARSIVLHRFGVDPEYKRKRLSVIGDDELAHMAESVDTEIQQIQKLIRFASFGFGSGLPGRAAIKSGMVLTQRNPPAPLRCGADRCDPRRSAAGCRGEGIPRVP